MADEIGAVVPGRQMLTPHIVVKGGEKALAFYAEALGARETFRKTLPNGAIMHASLMIGDSLMHLCDEFPNSCATSPATLGGTPVTLHLHVDDVDASYDRAVAAGATPSMPPADQFWGERYGQFVDPFGHRWSLAAPIASVSAEEVARKVEAFEPQPA